MRRSPAVTTLSAAAVLCALTGCGYNPFEPAGTTGERAEANAGNPPEFGELRQDIFDAMLSADSVTITGDVQAGEADLDELFDGLDEDTRGELQISGALDGRASEMSFAAGDSSFTQRAVDGEEYFRGEDFAALLVSELDDEVAEAVDEAFIEEVVANAWVQFDDAEDPQVFSAEEFITTWRQELDGEDIAAMQASSETVEGEPVWVYSADGGDSEFVVAAEGEPYLLSIRDEDSTYEFTDWNASEPPQVPENVITLDEIFEAIAEEQGWPTDGLGGEDDEDGQNQNDEQNEDNGP